MRKAFLVSLAVLLALGGCIPSPRWTVKQSTTIAHYDDSCIRQAIGSEKSVVGVVSYLPSQSYSLTFEPLPRYRQFMFESEAGLASLTVSEHEGRIKIDAHLSGYEEEMPAVVKQKGQAILDKVVAAVDRQCGYGS